MLSAASLALGLQCCRAEQAPKPFAPLPPARGDIVVVERAAAEFFEARVLSVAGESLKVQTTAEGDPLTVALNDAYPLKGASHRFTAGNFAICRSAPAHWEACRVVSPGDGSTDVELNAGERRSLAPGDLLAPGPVTVLDLERHFELYDARQRFANTALAAGHPHRPAGWTPAPHEPVLARRGHDWYLAHAAQLLADGGESVVLEGAGKAEGVPGSYVVPAPPFEHTFARGDFALVHPTTPGLPWERVSVEGIGPDGAVIVGASGERRRIEPRNLVPLQSGH